jgi:hypothetical protein
VDECAESSDNCPENSQCINLPGTFKCSCSSGFAPIGMPVEKCVGRFRGL